MRPGFGNREVFALAMLAALFSVAAPSGPLRAGNAPSAVLSVLPTSSELAQPGEEPEVLSENKQRAAATRKAVEERRKEHEKRVAERQEERRRKSEARARGPALDSQKIRTGVDKLQLVHIPKTGGSTMELVASSHGLKWGGRRTDWPGGNCAYGCPDSFQACSPWHLPPAAFREHGHDPYAGYDTFCVVRHPYSRLISEYTFMDAVCSAEGLNNAVHAMHKAINTSIGKLQTTFPHMKSHALKVSSQTQFGGVCGAVDARFHNGQCWRSPTHSDCHWLPQHLYAADCDHVLHVESLTDDFGEMMRSYDNAIDPQEIDDNQCLPDMPCERPDKCHLPVSALDSNSLTMLRELYAEDFEKFGYETEVRASRERFRLSASTHPHSERKPERIRVFGDDLVSASSPYFHDSRDLSRDRGRSRDGGA